MAIRKRVLKSGVVRWQAEYTDGAGKRRAKLFARQKDAEAWRDGVRQEVRAGTHTPASQSPTLSAAAETWIKGREERGREAATVRSYEIILRLHLLPALGGEKLVNITTPVITAMTDRLRADGKSADLIGRVVQVLGFVFKDARRRGVSSNNPTKDVELEKDDRADPRPVIPTKAELNSLIASARGFARPFVLVGIFCGLRASELRGLRWSDIDFDRKTLSVSQRADRFGAIGECKSASAYRTIPNGLMVVNALREWKLASSDELVFGDEGKVISHGNILYRFWEPLQKEALGEARYGLHAMRHAAASLWIARGLNPKVTKYRMGHATIQMTFDTFGHLFHNEDADQETAAGIEADIFATRSA